jgi:hypothetical protein
MKNTLNNRIFKMLAGLVLLTTLVLLVVVWNSSSKSTIENLADRLALAESVVVREIKSRQQMLIRNSHLLVDDFSFQRAVASRDKNTINQAIESYRLMIDAAFVSIRNLDGKEIESSGFMHDHACPLPTHLCL